MDDIWGNAWGEPSTSQHGSGTLPWASKPETLHQETSAAAGDEEADLAMPSWSTGSGMHWDEPPNLQGSLWSQTSPSSAAPWSLANPYSDIHITKAATSPPASDAEGSSHLANSLTASSPVIEVKEEEEVSPAASEPDVASEPPFESLSAPDQSPTSSPDAFGTFEVGAPQVHVDDADPWSSSAAVFDDELADAPDEWGSAWTGGQKRESEQDGGKMDEWESARRRKEEMDRRVPPELLASIMAQIDELTKDAWPDPEGATEEAEWQKRWHTGLDDVEGLDTLLHRYVPEMTLPQLPPFGKSFTGKAMASAVKLSRNSAIARASPMANFLAAKGSTAWETAVKSRVEVTTDEVPVGWRILEKEKEEKTDEKSKKSSTGLLASLWNRRASAAPREGITVTSPVQDSFPKEEKVTATGRSSMESVQSTNSAVTKPASPVTSSPSSASPVPTLTSTQTTPTTSYSESGLPSSEAITRGATPPPTAAPSAVSRFLNRFSRPRVPSASSPRNSLALSTDDLDFLTEFVPSVTDGDNEEMKDPQLRGLESMIASKPFTGRLPPPLPPPPPPPAPVPTMSTALPKTQPIDALSSFDDLILDTAASSTSSASRGTGWDPLGISSRPITPTMTPLSQPSQSPRTQTQRNGRTISTSSFSSTLSSPTETKSSFFVLPPPPSSSPKPNLISPPPRPASSLSEAPSRSQSPGTVAEAPAHRTPHSFPRPNLPTPKPTTSSMLSNALDYDDDFSDFHSSSDPQPPSSPSLLNATFTAAIPDNEQFLFPPPPKPIQPPIAFDDFADFLSPSVKPAASSASSKPSLSPLLPPVNVSVSTPSPVKTLADRRRGSRASEQQHTLSLMERAAARPGRWPAPPSPLPEALSPPPQSTSSRTGDLLSTPTDPQFSNVPPSTSSPAVLGQRTDPPPPAPAPASKPLRPSNHQHKNTLSLLEFAASRPGRWPAPPSPLPEALPPPPAGTGGGTFDADFLGATPTEASVFSVQQSASMPAFSNKFDPPAPAPAPAPKKAPAPSPSKAAAPSPVPLLPPPGSSAPLPKAPPARPRVPAISTIPLLPPPGGSQGARQPLSQRYSPDSTPLAFLIGNAAPAKPSPSPAPPPAPSGQKGPGGLSAQDLSFFEGF